MSRRSRAVRFALLGLAATLACARTPVRSEPQTVALGDATGRGWAALVGGDTKGAEAIFARPDTGDWVARFGAITVAHQAGRDSQALASSLDLLEEAGRAPVDPWRSLIVDATAARLRELVEEVVDPAPLERRLLSLQMRHLPWRARLAVEDAVDLVARRRGNAALLAARPAQAGCVPAAQLVGVFGRLPHVDLDAKWNPGPASPVPIQASGCRLFLPPRDGWPGIRVLRFQVPAGQGRALVLDFEGPARVFVDLDAGGEAPVPYRHDSDVVYAARTGVIALPDSDIPAQVEVRLGTFGGATELRLFVVAQPPVISVARDKLSPVTAALIDFAELLAAEAAGQTDDALAAVLRLEAHKRFSPGLAAAAEFVAGDPSRPSALARGEADSLLRRAVALDPQAVRALRALAASELTHGRGSEAAQLAEAALAANPRYWPAAVTLTEAQRSRGLERQADATLDRALAALGDRPGACPLVQLALDRARGRHRLEEEATFLQRLAACDLRMDQGSEWHMGRGEPAAARARFLRRGAVTLDPSSFAADAASFDVAAGEPKAAAARLAQAIEARQRDPALRLRLVDAFAAAGYGDRAAATLAATARYFPADSNVAKLARIRGLPLPMAGYHVDARQVIADYREANRAYDAPAVLVLDRTVVRAMGDGTVVVLTHNIVNVKTKDGITRWGEVQVPPGADILALRTHKADGSTREPEEISGKDTISAPDLAPGDFIEWETLEHRTPADGLAPGFLAERFYFQSVELPLHLSELVLVTPPGLAVALDLRAGAPGPITTIAADGARVMTFTAREMPQLFAERATVRAEEWIPSVRASAHLDPRGYVRTLRDNLFGISRGSPALRVEAQRIVAGAADPASRTRAIVRWVMDNIEPEAAMYESATSTLARGRGNRAALMVALARAVDLDATLVLARPLGTAPADAPLVAQELDDFSDLLVRFADPSGAFYVDPRYEHAAFGYLAPGIDGARVLVIADGALEIARSRSRLGDERRVALELAVDEAGQASGTVVETLSGWPAIEWAAFVKQLGDDSRKLRQEFEQRWLGQQFPGARLDALAIEVDRARPGEARLRYSLVGLDLAGENASSGRIALPCFRGSPGRRFATLPARKTALLLGPDIPLSLVARVHLPGVRVTDPGRSGRVDGAEAGAKGLVFFEERRLVSGPASGTTVEIRRGARWPLLVIAPAAYLALAPKLRLIDALERAEIQFAPAGQAAPAQP